MTTIDALWQRLTTDGESDAGYVRLRIPGIDVVSVYAARRIGSGLEALVMELSTTDLPGALSFPTSAAFSVTPAPLTPGRSGRTRYILALEDERYTDVFRALVEDLAGEIAGAATPRGAVTAMAAQLHRWQAFLRAVGSEGMSLDLRRGLAGELMFLRDELLPRSGGAVLDAWTGWDMANHDFQLTNANVEIKSTVANTPHAIQISNVRQLDDSTTPALYLCLTLLDESANSGEPLSDVVESVRACLPAAAHRRFDDQLAAYGYMRADVARYPKPLYTVRERQIFEVREGFPRLVPAGLPEGVEEVRYSISLGACFPFRTDVVRTLDLIASGSKGQ